MSRRRGGLSGELIFEHAFAAQISHETSEMQHFARELFLLSRQCGAAGLAEEARTLFDLARQASGTDRSRGIDFLLYGACARLVDGGRWGLGLPLGSPQGMSTNPDVSVVMSVYNGASNLAVTMNSILSQEGVELEFIVVNDGSTDKTGEILDDYARRDDRVRVIHQGNTGLTRALIRGCAAATGEFIARQDAGDVSLAGRLALQLDVFRNNSNVVMTSCGTRFVGPGNEVLYEVRQVGDELHRGLQHVDIGRIYGPSSHTSVMFRRETYEKVGGYRAQFDVAQDLDLWMRLAEAGMCWATPEVLCEFHLSKNSISAVRRE